MPCRGLPSIAAELEVLQRVSLKELSASVSGEKNSTRVVVDGVALLYFILSKTEWSFAGEGDEIRAETICFCKGLHDAGVRMLVLFDGVISHDNYEGGLRKSSEKVRKVEATMRLFNTMPFRHMPRRTSSPVLPTLALEVIIETLRELEVPFKVCESECARYVHHVAKTNKVMLIGYDSNYLCVDTPGYLHCDSLQFGHDDVKANIVVPSAFAEALGIEVSRLPLLSCILGNEVAPEWAFTTFHRHLVPADQQENRKEVVMSVAKWLSEQPKELTNEEVFAKVVELEVTPLPEDRVTEQELKRIEDAKLAAAESEDEGASSFAAYLCGDADYKREALAGFYERNETLFTPMPLVKKHLKRPQTFYKSITGKSSVSDISNAYTAGQFSNLLLSVLICGVAWIRPTLEDIASEAACNCALPLRQAAYAALLSEGTGCAPDALAEGVPEENKVREARREGTEYVLTPVEPMWKLPSGRAMPALKTLQKMDADARANIVLEVCGFSASEIVALRTDLPESWWCIAGALRFLLNSCPDLEDWEVLALVEHIVSPTPSKALKAQHSTESLSRGPTDFHRAAQWQHIINGVLMLNSALGNPLVYSSVDVPLATVYNGMAFCASRAESKRGTGLFMRSRYLLRSENPIADVLAANAAPTASDGFQVSQRKRQPNQPKPEQYEALERGRLLCRSAINAVKPSVIAGGVAPEAPTLSKKRDQRVKVSTKPTLRRGGSKFAFLDSDDEE